MPFRWFDLLAILLVPLGAWLAREHLLFSAARQAAEKVAGENASLPSRPGFARHGVDDRHAEPAWEAYGRALRLSLPSDPAFAGAAALLRQGAGSTRAVHPELDLRDPSETYERDMLACFELAGTMLAHARDSVAADDRRAALQLALDVAVFGRDVAASGTLLGWYGGNHVVEEAVTTLAEVASRDLDRDDLAWLALQLEQLEDALPPLAFAMRNELAYATFAIDDAMPEGGLPDRVLYTAFAGSALRQLRDHTDELVAADRLPWPAARTRAEQVHDAVEQSWNPLLRALTPLRPQRLLEHSRRRVALLRALRVIAHHLAHARALELDDPFGTGSLQLEVEADGAVRCRSVGPDGAGLEVRVR